MTLIHQLERGWIDPVRILENNKHWTAVRKQDQLLLQYLHGPLLLDQFVNLQGRIALSERDRQQSGQKRGSLDSTFRGALQNAFQLVELSGSGICSDDARVPIRAA